MGVDSVYCGKKKWVLEKNKWESTLFTVGQNEKWVPEKNKWESTLFTVGQK